MARRRLCSLIRCSLLVLALLDQLEVGRVAVPGEQLESDGDGATAVDFGRHDGDDDASTASGCGRDTRRCS